MTNMTDCTWLALRQPGKIQRLKRLLINAAIESCRRVVAVHVYDRMAPGVGILEVLDEWPLCGEQLAAEGDSVRGVTRLQIDQIRAVAIDTAQFVARRSISRGRHA